MKDRRVGPLLLALVVLVLLVVSLMSRLRSSSRWNRLFSAENALDTLRAQEVSLEELETFRKWEKEGSSSRYEYLFAWMLTGEEKRGTLERYIRSLQAQKDSGWQEMVGYLEAVWADLQYFPVPNSTVSGEETVSFVNSWLDARTFGGSRGHEGCDLMAACNVRGRYPVVSMTDGVVEKIGWLTQGGYRIGIRAPHGGYFYYAHLYDYAGEFQPGDEIKAGELLGFLGDSGYGEEEGTVGNFAVHLHMGIYVTAPDGREISVNSYWPLKFLETKKLRYFFII